MLLAGGFVKYLKQTIILLSISMEAIRYLLSSLLALMGIFYNSRINNIIYCVYYKRYQVLFFFILCAGVIFIIISLRIKFVGVFYFLFSALKFWALLTRHC